MPAISRQATSGWASLTPSDKMRRGFTEHFDPSLRGCLDHGIFGELMLVRCVLDEQIAHLEHVENPVAVAPHSSIASASTR